MPLKKKVSKKTKKQTKKKYEGDKDLLKRLQQTRKKIKKKIAKTKTKKKVKKNPKHRKAIKNVLEKVWQNQLKEEGWNKHEYDGILGNPPSWLPNPLIREFISIRFVLLDNGYKPEDIRNFMTGRRKEVTPGFGWHTAYPMEVQDKLDALNYIQDLVILGSEKGPEESINVYLGRSPAEILRGCAISQRNREAGKKRAGRKGPLRIVIERLKPKNLEHLLNLLEDEDGILDLYGARKNPIDIIIQEVDRDKGVVDYRTRDAEEKSVAFKTLQNIISLLKK
jgi:hypothetical protein